MTVLDDVNNAVANYPVSSVDVSITDFSVIGGGVLNTGDKAQFKVEVRNNGPLNMANVTVRVFATSWSDVSKDNVTFLASSVLSSTFTVAIAGHGGSSKSAFFYLKAKAVTGGLKDIVTARLESWDASWDHILNGHSGAGPVEGKLSQQILAT